MEFSHAEYFDLLRLYETYSDKAKGKEEEDADDVVRDAACAWLKQGRKFNELQVEKSLSNGIQIEIRSWAMRSALGCVNCRAVDRGSQ